jgi:hypothetical protein
VDEHLDKDCRGAEEGALKKSNSHYCALRAVANTHLGIWISQLPTNIQVGPLPGQHLKVRLDIEVRFGGDYFIEVSPRRISVIGETGYISNAETLPNCAQLL